MAHALTRDRSDYRTMPTEELLREAHENGISAELAIVLAERLEELTQPHG